MNAVFALPAELTSVIWATAAGSLEVRIRERRAAMWGYDSPQRFDMVQVTEGEGPSSFEVTRSAINRVIEQAHLQRGEPYSKG